MQRKSSKRTGDKTNPAQRRINRELSVKALSRLLELNFPAGAQMITLAYESVDCAPVGECAEADIRTWVRLARVQIGGVFRYVRAIGQGGGNEPAIVHRIITELPNSAAWDIATIWPCGFISVEEIGAGELPTLAGWFAANAAGPNRKTWVSSRGLKRP